MITILYKAYICINTYSINHGNDKHQCEEDALLWKRGLDIGRILGTAIIVVVLISQAKANYYT